MSFVSTHVVPFVLPFLYTELLNPVPRTLSHILVWPVGALPHQVSPNSASLHTHSLPQYPIFTIHPRLPSSLPQSLKLTLYASGLNCCPMGLFFIDIKVQLRSGILSLLRNHLSPSFSVIRKVSSDTPPSNTDTCIL